MTRDLIRAFLHDCPSDEPNDSKRVSFDYAQIYAPARSHLLTDRMTQDYSD